MKHSRFHIHLKDERKSAAFARLPSFLAKILIPSEDIDASAQTKGSNMTSVQQCWETKAMILWVFCVFRVLYRKKHQIGKCVRIIAQMFQQQTQILLSSVDFVQSFYVRRLFRQTKGSSRYDIILFRELQRPFKASWQKIKTVVRKWPTVRAKGSRGMSTTSKGATHGAVGG